MPTLDAGTFQACNTSPMWWWNGNDLTGVPAGPRIVGMEPTLEAFLGKQAGIFDQIKDLLVDTGTLWLVLGDKAASEDGPGKSRPSDIAVGELLRMPELFIERLVDRGWILQIDRRWRYEGRPDDEPEPHIYMLSKTAAYQFADVKPEPIWEIPHDVLPIEPTTPVAMVDAMVRSSCIVGDKCLDPFVGLGTTGLVCERLGVDFVGIDTSAIRAEHSRTRIADNRDEPNEP